MSVSEPTLQDFLRETKTAIQNASGMLEYLCHEHDLDGSAIAYLAVQQLAALLESLGGKPVTATVRPHDPDAKAFFEAVMRRALEYSNRDEPAVVTLQRLQEHISKRFRGAPPPIELMQGSSFKIDGAGVISSLRSRGKTTPKERRKKRCSAAKRKLRRKS